MEPPCEHGGVMGCSLGNFDQRTLQWSRRVNTAECPAHIDRVFQETGLQWSRRVNTAECAECARLPFTAESASMEPPCEHGGVTEWIVPFRLRSSFNGAAG